MLYNDITSFDFLNFIFILILIIVFVWISNNNLVAFSTLPGFNGKQYRTT